MPKKTTTEEFRPFEDERGALRLDRPFTPAEALKLHETRRAAAEEQRRERFLRTSARHRTAAERRTS